MTKYFSVKYNSISYTLKFPWYLSIALESVCCFLVQKSGYQIISQNKCQCWKTRSKNNLHVKHLFRKIELIHIFKLLNLHEQLSCFYWTCMQINYSRFFRLEVHSRPTYNF